MLLLLQVLKFIFQWNFFFGYKFKVFSFIVSSWLNINWCKSDEMEQMIKDNFFDFFSKLSEFYNSFDLIFSIDIIWDSEDYR
jgi:hypothetical protein